MYKEKLTVVSKCQEYVFEKRFNERTQLKGLQACNVNLKFLTKKKSPRNKEMEILYLDKTI